MSIRINKKEATWQEVFEQRWKDSGMPWTACWFWVWSVQRCWPHGFLGLTPSLLHQYPLGTASDTAFLSKHPKAWVLVMAELLLPAQSSHRKQLLMPADDQEQLREGTKEQRKSLEEGATWTMAKELDRFSSFTAYQPQGKPQGTSRWHG